MRNPLSTSASKRCRLSRGARLRCAHVTTSRPQSPRLRELDRRTRRRGPRRARRDRRSRCRCPARARSPACRGRFGAHATRSRARRIEGSRRRTTRPRAIRAVGSTRLRQRKARPRHRDRGASRFVTRRIADDRAAHHRRSDDARTIHEQRRPETRQWCRPRPRRKARLARHVQRNACTIVAGGHGDRASPKETRQVGYATCGAAKVGAATSAVAPRSRG
jgi:hypothetical protein